MKISFAGDFCSEGRIESIIDKGVYKGYFSGVRSYLLQSDYSIVNLECPICEKEYTAIPKCGPNLKSNPNILDAIKYMGFGGVCLANNHINDYGKVGIRKTIEMLKKYGIDYVGVGENLTEANSPLYVSRNAEIVAILNCCEHEFSIVGKDRPGAAPINPVTLYYQIKDAKQKCNYVAVIVHGGSEHCQFPSQRMVETYRFFIDCGADAVINHHQHCYSGYELYNEKPIFYGLGNFCFDGCDKVRKQWNRGIIVTIDFNDLVHFEIMPYIQNESEPGIKICEKGSADYCDIISGVNRLSDIISDPNALNKAYNKFIESTNSFYRMAIEPYSNYYIRALYEKGFIPSCLSKEKKLLLYNLISCESHRERLLESLFDEINK